MPKDFDARRQARHDKDRKFVLHGAEFELRVGIRPEALAGYDDLDAATSTAETLKTIDDLVKTMIHEEGHARWDEIRADTEDPVTLDDMTEVVQWMMEETTGRVPTPPPSPSPAGPPTTGMMSMPVSGSRATQPVPAS